MRWRWSGLALAVLLGASLATQASLSAPDLDSQTWPGWSFTKGIVGYSFCSYYWISYYCSTSASIESFNVGWRVTNSPAGPDWDAAGYDANHALYWGDPYDRDFNTGVYANYGTAQSPVIRVPPARSAGVTWDDWHKIEDYPYGGYWDESSLYVVDLTAKTSRLLTRWFGSDGGNEYQPYWVTYGFDISEMAGHDIQVYLTFHTKDSLYNRIDAHGQRVYGWFVDNIRVTADGATVYSETFEPAPAPTPSPAPSPTPAPAPSAPATATVVVKPQKWNLNYRNSQGQVKVEISGIPINEVDLTTITMTGGYTAHKAIIDTEENKINAFFYMSDVYNLIKDEQKGSKVPVKITGKYFGGGSFEGTDTVMVLGKG